MTMAANPARKLSGEEGQSVIEFLFMLPVMLGLVVLLIRINTAIQISIVDQQYARAQTLWLAFNSGVYPQIHLRYPELVAKKYNQMLIGVSDNVVPADGSYEPKATVQNILRVPASAAGTNNSPQTEPDPNAGGTRALVRVRNTVSLCTQANILSDGTPILSIAGQAGAGATSYALQETSKFDYCSAKGGLNE